MWMFRPFSCGTLGSGGIVLMSSGTNVFGSSCANRTRYSTPPACSNAIWIASRIDWFTLFGVPFARPPQRVPFGGLGGIAGPEGVGAVSEPGVAVAAEAKSGRHWTFDVIPLFRHYFSGNSSLNLRSFPTNQALRGSSPPCPLGGVASKPPLLFVAETRGGALARPATIPRAGCGNGAKIEFGRFTRGSAVVPHMTPVRTQQRIPRERSHTLHFLNCSKFAGTRAQCSCSFIFSTRNTPRHIGASSEANDICNL
jgi:hypothetical protein